MPNVNIEFCLYVLLLFGLSCKLQSIEKNLVENVEFFLLFFFSYEKGVILFN